MNHIMFSLHVLLAIVTLNPGIVHSVRIEIKAVEITGLVLKAANITCHLDDMKGYRPHVLSMQLVGPNNTTIVNMSPDFTSVTDDLAYGLSNMKVDGIIHQDIGKSYLRIAISDIVSAQSGFYSCHVVFFNDGRFMEHVHAGDNMKAGELDMEKVMPFLMSRISNLELENQKKERERENMYKKGMVLPSSKMRFFQAQLDRLDDLTRNQAEMISSLNERGSHMSAFSASYDHSDTLRLHGVVVFRNLILRIGDGYDQNSGIFTAPRPGYYVFHLTVMYQDDKSGELSVDIVANGNHMVSVCATDTQEWEQPTISTVVQLAKGDRVKCVVASIGWTKRLNGVSRRSVFTGYLVQAL